MASMEVNPNIANSSLVKIGSVVIFDGVAPAALAPRVFVREVIILNYVLNSRTTLSCTDNVSTLCVLAEEDFPFVTPASTYRKHSENVVSHLMATMCPEDVSSSVNVVPIKQVHDIFASIPNIGFKDNDNFVNVPISVMYNADMKSHMASSSFHEPSRVQNPIQVDCVAYDEKKNKAPIEKPKEVQVDQALVDLTKEVKNKKELVSLAAIVASFFWRKIEERALKAYLEESSQKKKISLVSKDLATLSHRGRWK
ncbi:hypothetical protein MA16_Dca021911 [Dendrobium catenatum]|uniref:Uncharacterized protein n=1 Tax=Dendrobium catenatum TaxID=906689 RepID=A0A2I0VT62_9ASPA|nr:hypothetical protein MA16_Dca021911 [Dendrobium catenatum]